MYRFKKDIQDEIDTIKKLIKILEQGQYKVPNYKLICKTEGNRIYYRKQYYVVNENGEKKRVTKYLGKSDSSIVIRYKLSKHQLKKLNILKKDLKIIKKFLKEYLDYSSEAIQRQLPKTYRLMPDQFYFFNDYPTDVQWEEHKKRQANYCPLNSGNITCDGTPVASKGEVIIYDILKTLRIDFVYAIPLEVYDEYYNKCYIRPDFTIRTRSGKLIIIEHEGMWSDDAYRTDKIKKFGWYENSGYILGKNFFITGDDKNGNTDAQALTRFAKNLIVSLVNEY